VYPSFEYRYSKRVLAILNHSVLLIPTYEVKITVPVRLYIIQPSHFVYEKPILGIWTPEGKGSFGKLTRRREDNIKTYFKETEYKGADWIQVAQDRI
jgi:hypothetical protein